MLHAQIIRSVLAFRRADGECCYKSYYVFIGILSS